MGQSTNGVLFYGYAWNDEHEEFTEDDYDTSEAGKKEFGVEIGRHCCDEYPVPYIFISKSEVTAYRGDVEPIDPANFPSDTSEWNKRLENFITKFGIDITVDEWSKPVKGPGWFLVSWRG